MYIPEYYQMFREEDPQNDFKEVVFEAARYIFVQLQKAYDGKNLDPVDLSELPGLELGFEPVEIVSVSAPTVDNRREAKKTGHYTASVTYKRMLARDYWTKTYPISTEAAADKSVFNSEEAPGILRNVYDEVPDMGDTPYGIFRPNVSSGQRRKLVPILCNKRLGTVYYIIWMGYVDLIEDFKKASLDHPAKIRGIDYTYCSTPIVAINWITGDVGFIYDYIFKESYYTGWSLYACSWGITESVDPKGCLDSPRERMKVFYSRGDETDVTYMHLPKDDLVKQLSEHKIAPSYVETFSFLEDVYVLPRNALQKVSLNQLDRYFANRAYEPASIADGLFSTLVYTKNMFQSILQTWDLNNWLLPLILSSIRLGKPMQENYKSIPQWFNIPKPDYKALTSEPDEAKFVFYLCMNQFAPTSMKVFEKTYAKVLELSELCDENKLERSYSYKGITYRYDQKRVAIKGKHGRILLKTYSLPDPMTLYTEHDLYKRGLSINHYFKWLINECYIAAHSERPDIDRETHICGLIEEYTEDYNRMAKEISPNVPFTLPHNVCAAHDTMVTNYNKIMAEKLSLAEDVDTDLIYKLAACYRGADADALAPLPTVGCEKITCDEKFIMIEPKKPADIYDEGIVLNHCVGSYCNDIIVARGSMRIYFMRPRRLPNHNLVTVQVNRLAATGEYYISEAAGKANRKLTAEEDAYLKRWIEVYNTRIKFLAKEKAEIDELMVKKPKFAPMYSREFRRWVLFTAKGKLRVGVLGNPRKNVVNALKECVDSPDTIFRAANYKTAADRILAIKTQCAYILGKDGNISLSESSAVIAYLCE